MGSRNRQFWYAVYRGVLFYLCIAALCVLIGPAIAAGVMNGSHPLHRPLAERVAEEVFCFIISPPFALVALLLLAYLYGKIVYRSQMRREGDPVVSRRSSTE